MSKRVLSLIALAAVVLLAGCGGDSEPSGATEAGETTTSPVELAVFAVGRANTYVQAELEGIEEVAASEGAEVTVYDAEFDPAKQISQIQDAITAGRFDAFIVQAVDGNGVAPAVEEAIDAGIPVSAVFVPIGPDPASLEPQVEGLLTTVAPSMLQNGDALADMTVTVCEDKDPCRVAFLPGLLALPYESVRLDRYKERLAQHENIRLVAVQEGEYLADPALAVTQNILQANPEIDVIATAGDQMTIGAEQAVGGTGRSGEVSLIGNGASRIGVEAVEEGRWFGTVASVPFSEGQEVTELTIAALRGEDVPASVNSFDLSPVGGSITQANVEDFEAQWEG